MCRVSVCSCYSQHVQSECVQLLQLSCAEQVYVAIAASKCMQLLQPTHAERVCTAAAARCSEGEHASKETEDAARVGGDHDNGSMCLCSQHHKRNLGLTKCLNQKCDSHDYIVYNRGMS